jgi:hypothetical protein
MKQHGVYFLSLLSIFLIVGCTTFAPLAPGSPNVVISNRATEAHIRVTTIPSEVNGMQLIANLSVKSAGNSIEEIGVQEAENLANQGYSNCTLLVILTSVKPGNAFFIYENYQMAVYQ